MAANVTTTVYLGGPYDQVTPRVRVAADVHHVNIEVGRLDVCAVGADGLAQLREIAAAFEEAADRYALARVQAVPA